jgi:hypothetical protein
MQLIQLLSAAVFLGTFASAASIEKRTETEYCGKQVYIIGDVGIVVQSIRS